MERTSGEKPSRASPFRVVLMLIHPSSLLEIYKLVPTFLRNFEVELETPGTEWQTYNAWFVRQLNFHTKFRPRTVPADSRRDSLA